MNDQKKLGSKLLKGCLITACVLLGMGDVDHRQLCFAI
jgi:hypothetical protein